MIKVQTHNETIELSQNLNESKLQVEIAALDFAIENLRAELKDAKEIIERKENEIKSLTSHIYASGSVLNNEERYIHNLMEDDNLMHIDIEAAFGHIRKAILIDK